MMRFTELSAKHAVLGILLMFMLWCVISIAWYAHAQTLVMDFSGTGLVRSTSQQSVAVAYDRAGTTGELFIMLMIAFTLGALLGRILSAPSHAEQPSLFDAPQKSGEPERRMSAPTHISEFTKNIPRPAPHPMPAVPAPRPAPVIHAPQPIIKPMPAPAPKPAAPVIRLGPAIPAQVSSPQKPQEHPKMKFNTSWNNPNREKKA